MTHAEFVIIPDEYFEQSKEWIKFHQQITGDETSSRQELAKEFLNFCNDKNLTLVDRQEVTISGSDRTIPWMNQKILEFSTVRNDNYLTRNAISFYFASTKQERWTTDEIIHISQAFGMYIRDIIKIGVSLFQIREIKLPNKIICQTIENSSEIIHNAVNVLENQVLANSDISVNEEIYRGMPVIFYSDMSEDELEETFLKLSVLDQQKLLESIKNIYPRTFDQIKDVYMQMSKSKKYYEDNIPETANKCTRVHSFISKTRVSGFGIGDGMFSDHSALYNIGTRFNHSCDPNCCWTIDIKTNEMTIKSIKGISSNEELTINYWPKMKYTDVSKRKNFLKKMGLFDCNCTICR